MYPKCRVCLFKIEPENCKNIFTVAKNGELMAEILSNFAGVQINEDDGFPKILCLNCEEKMNLLIDFQSKIKHSDSELRKNSSNSLFQPNNLVKPELSEGVMSEKPNRLYCTECDQYFRYHRDLKAHNTLHTGQIYVCKVCLKGFTMKFALKNHERVHTEERSFKCNDCGKAYKQPSALSTHVKTHHSNLILNKCEICEKIFTTRDKLKEHHNLHTGEKPFICEFCSKQFALKSSLCHHLKVHTSKKQRVACPKCQEMYPPHQLNKHLKITHSGEKRYSCEICNKRFSTNSSKRIHMRIHEGVKPYSCHICEKSFTQSSILVRHLRVHSGETPYHCKFCVKRFPYSHHLLKHVRREHSNDHIHATA